MKQGKKSTDSRTVHSLFNRLYSWSLKIVPLVIVLVGWLFYAPSLTYDFQFDDLANIHKHFAIRNETFSRLAFGGPRWISYWLNTVHYKIGKFNPWSYRALNVAVHLITGLLLFYILHWALSKARNHPFLKKHSLSIAGLTSALFVLHPVQTQTISYVIQGQLEGIATFFIMSVVFCFIKYTRARTPLSKLACGSAVFALGILGCGSKEIMIVSPLLIALVNWFFIAQGSWHEFKKHLAFHTVFLLVIGAFYLYLLRPDFFISTLTLKRVMPNNIGNVLTEKPGQLITPGHFFISQFKVILHYLWIFIWPFGISVDYDWKLSRSFFASDCLLPLCALMLLGLTILYLLRKNNTHIAAFSFLWFFICILPRASVIPSTELLADYKTYAGSLGMVLLIAIAAVYFYSLATQKVALLKKHRAQVAIFVLTLAGLGVLTYQRNKVWRSGTEFWENVITNAPGKARAYNNYGVQLSEKGEYSRGIPLFRKAIKMDAVYPDPHNNLAVAYSAQGKVDLAIETLQNAIRINPKYPEFHNNIASFFIQKKDYVTAEQELKLAISLRPHYGKAFFNLGRIKLAVNKPEEAWHSFKTACLNADFDTENGFIAYGTISSQLAKYEDAIVGLGTALKINPANMETAFNLANVYYYAGHYNEAIQAYQHVLQRHPNELKCHYNIGECLLKSKRYQEALNAFKAAAALSPQTAHAHVRIAECLHHLGDQRQALTMLEEIIADKSLSQDINMLAQNRLTFLRDGNSVVVLNNTQ